MPSDDEPMIAVSTMKKRLDAKQARIEQLEIELSTSKTKSQGLEEQIANMPNVPRLEKRLAKAEQAREELEQAFDRYRAEATSERAIMAAGVTDAEDMDLVRWRYSRLPEEGRPSLSDYLENQAKEDRHLASLFKAPADTPDSSPEAPRLANGVRPRASLLPPVNGGTKPAAAPPKSLTREAIMSMPYAERVDPKNRDLIRAVLQNE